MNTDVQVSNLMGEIINARNDYRAANHQEPPGVLHISHTDAQMAWDTQSATNSTRDGTYMSLARRMHVGDYFTYLGMAGVVDGDLQPGEFRWQTEPAPPRSYTPPEGTSPW